MAKNCQKIVENVQKLSKKFKNSQNCRKTVKVLKVRHKTTKYVEKPLKNFQKCAKTVTKT